MESDKVVESSLANSADEPSEIGSKVAPVPISPSSRELLPPVSPIKTNAHRKHVVAYKLEHPSMIPAGEPSQDSRESDKLAKMLYPARQPTWEKRTSPPRVRNRHFTDHPSPKRHIRVRFAMSYDDAGNTLQDDMDADQVQNQSLFNDC